MSWFSPPPGKVTKGGSVTTRDTHRLARDDCPFYQLVNLLVTGGTGFIGIPVASQAWRWS